MAETVHLWLKANGADIAGEPTQTNRGGVDLANTIECLYFEQSVRTAREAGSGMASGRRQYEPLLIRKRIDKATPLIWKALVLNEVVDGVFKFFRPNPTGDGTTQMFYSIEIKEGRVASVRDFNPDTIQPASSTMPPMEEVTFVFNTISWTIADGGITHEDSWRQVG